jgi:hypothetical protein
VTITATIPAAKAARTGGSTFSIAGTAPDTMKATTIASAIQKLSSKPVMILRPNGRNTPQTMPITTGNGQKLMTLRTQPVMPSTAIKRPAAMLAPTTSAKLK